LVYVTDYGDRYHSSLSCSGLKRTVYSVPKSEAIGKGACSKCAK
ncbi:MAG: pilus assembly protein, partial [Dorea sp.]|nr:pilus assembly protein [Dorea sp.]